MAGGNAEGQGAESAVEERERGARLRLQQAEQVERQQAADAAQSTADALLRARWAALFDQERAARQAVGDDEGKGHARLVRKHRALGQQAVQDQQQQQQQQEPPPPQPQPQPQQQQQQQQQQRQEGDPDVRAALLLRCRQQRERIAELCEHVVEVESPRTQDSEEFLMASWSPRKALSTIGRLQEQLRERREAIAQLRAIAEAAGLELPRPPRSPGGAEQELRRQSTAESEDLVGLEGEPEPHEAPKSARAVPGLTIAPSTVKDSELMEQLRQECALRFDKQFARAVSYNDVDALQKILQERQEQEQREKQAASKSAPRRDSCESEDLADATPVTASPRTVPKLAVCHTSPAVVLRDTDTQEQVRQEMAGRYNKKLTKSISHQNVGVDPQELNASAAPPRTPSSSCSSSSGGSVPPADDKGSSDSEDLAPVTKPPASPRGVPRLPVAEAEQPPPAAGGSPLPKAGMVADPSDDVLQEILRQERALRKNKYMARAASYDDVGRLADLIPKLSVGATRAPAEGLTSPTADDALKEQLQMEQRGRNNKHFAKTMSMADVGKVGTAMLPKLDMMPAGFDPRTPTRGGAADWNEELAMDRDERSRRAPQAITSPCLEPGAPSGSPTSFVNAAVSMDGTPQ